MYQNPYAILFFLVLLWPIDFVFRTCVYFILTFFNSIIVFNSDFTSINLLVFAKGYLNSDAIANPADPAAIANTSAKYSLFVLLIVWLIAIFAIVTK